jgi:hypothetical protein
MPKFDESSNRSGNELGEFLPEEDAQLCEECELIQAFDRDQASRRCAKLAQLYGGTNPRVKPIERALYNCKFDVWR